MSISANWLGVACLALLLCPRLADAGAMPLQNPAPIPPGITNAHFKQIGPGQFELGKVRLDSQRRTLTFPAILNQEKGPVEYLLVGSQGKIHESVLRTEAAPYHIHLGMLLLGAKGAPKDYVPRGLPQPPPGDPIRITVTWGKTGQRKTVPAESLVLDQDAKTAMAAGEWTYNGSRIFEGTFLAQRDQSIIAIIGDLDALANNPRPRWDNDQNWQANPAACPPLETSVEVTLVLPKAQPASPKTSPPPTP